jgi:hypothetical protein
MRRLITVLVILLAIAVLAYSKTSVQLSGSDGVSLLNDLTNNSTNSSSSNGTIINLSHGATTKQLSGNDGTALLENLTNGSEGANNTTDDLSTWGSKPRTLPPPPIFDYKAAQRYEILRQNHLGGQA